MMIRYLLLAGACALVSPAQAESFSAFVQAVKPDALKQGVSAKTFAAATKGLKADPKIDKLTKRQPELVKPIGGYIEQRTKGPLIKGGRGKVSGLKRTLRGMEKQYGVDPYVVTAIWGMETGYGRGIGNSNVFRSLSTLAWKRYRDAFFRNELVDAMLIMQNEKMRPAQMVGSWAGAMGQTQFIPSSFRKFAVDFNGDGKRDLWGTKADALASTANYLKQKGWIRGQPWGYAVRLPKKLPKMAFTQPWKDWATSGVKALDSKAFPKSGEATLFFPAGEEGPSFLISPNYEVIRDYNSSDAYSISVGMIADRLRGGKYLRLKWPTKKTLNKAERVEVQKRLAKLGFEVPNRTGRMIRGVRAAVRDFQISRKLTADGYADQTLLRQLRGG